jgi:hypothetical protein
MATAGMFIVADSATTLSLLPGGNAANTYPAFDLADADLALRPVLLFKAIPHTSAGSIEVQWKLNTNVVVTTNFASDVGRSFHEVVNNDVLQATGNILEVEAKSGSGSVDVSDIILHYRV